MNDETRKQPWYFLWAGICYIATILLEKVFSIYFSDTAIKRILELSIKVKVILPFAVFLIVIGICTGKYIKQLRKTVNRHLTPSEFEQVEKVSANIVSNVEYVESVQAYQYWFKNDNDSKYIKVCYLAGSADERIDINSIMQTYYYIPYSLEKKLKNITAQYDNYTKEADGARRLEYKKQYKNSGKEFCELALNSLNGIKSIHEIGKYHCELYRITLRILSLISDEPIETIMKDETIENEIIRRRKTGILGSIIIHDSYVFKNQTSSTKCNRIYLTFPYDIKKGIVLLVSMNNNSLQGVGDTDISEYCQQIIAEARNVS